MGSTRSQDLVGWEDDPGSTSSSTLSAKTVTVFYSNITKWGPQATSFLSGEQAHIIMLTEHHLDESLMGPAIKDIEDWKRRPFYNPAFRRGLHVSATSGGQMILPRTFLGCRKLDPSILHQILPREEHWLPPRWTSCILRTKGVSILFVVVYLFTAEGLSDRNMAVISQICTLVSIFKGPVVIAGDWQVTPDVLATSPLIRRLGLIVKTPCGTDATCKVGAARLIDYFLVSPAIAPYITATAEFSVPWKDHIGIRMVMPARLRAYSAPSLRIPAPLPPLPLVDGTHNLEEESWQKAVQVADSVIAAKSFGTGIIGCTPRMKQMMHRDQADVSVRLCLAATRIEAYSCVVSGTPAHSKFFGRGGFPHFQVKPVVHRSYRASRFSCPTADFWNMVESNLGWIKKAFSGSQARVAICRAILHLKSAAERMDQFWCRGAAPNCPVHAWRKWIRDLCWDYIVQAHPGFSADRIDIWCSRAAAQTHRAVAAKASAAKKSFRSWLLQDLQKGAAGAHKLVSAAGRPPAFEMGTCDSVFQQWSSLWHAEYSIAAPSKDGSLISGWTPWREQLVDLVAAISPDAAMQSILSEHREHLAGNDTSMYVSPEQLRSAATTYPDLKGKGADCWSTGFLRTLPLSVLEGLSDVLTRSQVIMMWPAQLMLNLMALIPKPQGGERAVAKAPMLYRLWNVICTPQLKEWSASTAPEWDYATQGKSAMFAATLRAWANEAAQISGRSATSLLWDIEKKFDSIRPQDVVREGIHFQYPSRPLILGLSMHMAPRVLTLQGVASKAMMVHRSILAGCSNSIGFARLIMTRPIQRIVEEVPPPRMKLSTFVDDVAQAFMGTQVQVSRSAAVAAVSFCSAMRGLALRISSKTVVVSSDAAISRRLVSVIRSYPGVVIKQDTSARDLGILNNPSSVRRTSMQMTRVNKASSKLRKIAPLAKSVRKARSLIHTGALPQAYWGSAALGVSPTIMASIRRQAGAATGIVASGRCLTTALAITLGPMRDPGVALPVSQVSTWMDIWQADPHLRTITARHWGDLCDNVLRIPGDVPKPQWGRVVGPAGGTISMLHDLDWDLRNPLEWRDPTGKAWTPDFSVHKRPFLDLVAQLASAKLWKEASSHYLGTGLQGGVAWQASSALLRHLSSKLSAASSAHADSDSDEFILELDGDHWHAHAITWLELFLCGGYWTQERAAAVHPISSRCTRCRAGAPETPLHLLWTCSANERINDERVSSTQQYISQAVEGSRDYPCLWLRGLLPSSLVTVNTPYVMDEQLHFVGRLPPEPWPAGDFYSDASGGPFSSIAAIRRCGVGIAVIQEAPGSDHTCFELVWGVFAPLIGTHHTVPRAELYAMVVIAQHLGPGRSTLRSDSKVNVDLFAKGKAACVESANSDLWMLLWEVLDRGDVQLVIIWVKGHADDPLIFEQYQVSVRDLYGNLFADKLADRAAEVYQVYAHDAFAVQWYYSLVRRIQARAVVIMTQCMERRVVGKQAGSVPKLPALAASSNIIRSQHRCVYMGKLLHCDLCFQFSPVGSAQKNAWLTAPCVPDRAMMRTMYFGAIKPTRLHAGASVKVGRTQIHSTHELAVYKGLYFCMQCGYHASKKAQHLANPCMRASAKGHTERRLGLLRGKLPSGLSHWPNDAPASSWNVVTLL